MSEMLSRFRRWSREPATKNTVIAANATVFVALVWIILIEGLLHD